MELGSIGKNIRKFRLAAKLRQEDLAEKTGLSTNYIGMLERGEKLPSLETFIGIANALDISADMILSDVIHASCPVKYSLLAERMAEVPSGHSAMICDVIETLLRHSSKA